MWAKFFRRRVEPEFKVVCDSESIVYPVDFFAPDYPYEQAFQEADAYVRRLPLKGTIPVSDLLRLQFYSLFKQATEGDINPDVKPPSVFRDWEGYWKVYGWRKLRGMTREKARDMYIELLDVQIRRHFSFVWGAPAAEDRWQAFHEGVKIVRNLPKGGYRLPDSLRARFYALYKQSHFGDFDEFRKRSAVRGDEQNRWRRDRPSKAGFDQLRYDEWAALKGMSCEKAKRTYCQEMFKTAAMCGYVWAPPGTEDHLEVIGDQTSRKNLKKRADADTDAERIEKAAHLSIEEFLYPDEIKLSMIERLRVRAFLREEKKHYEYTTAPGKTQERGRGCSAHSHTDPNEDTVDTGSREETSTEGALTAEEKITLKTEGMDGDSQNFCSFPGSFVSGAIPHRVELGDEQDGDIASFAAQAGVALSVSPASMSEPSASVRPKKPLRVSSTKRPVAKAASKGTVSCGRTNGRADASAVQRK